MWSLRTRPKLITMTGHLFSNIKKMGHLKYDYIKRLMKLTSDNIKRLSMYFKILRHVSVWGRTTMPRVPLSRCRQLGRRSHPSCRRRCWNRWLNSHSSLIGEIDTFLTVNLQFRSSRYSILLFWRFFKKILSSLSQKTKQVKKTNKKISWQ